MQTHLEHFRALSTKIEADRVAYNAAQTDLLERINAAASVAAHAEKVGADPAKHRATVRRLKAERAALRAPSFVNPLADVDQYARTHKTATAIEPVTVDVPKGQTPLAVHNNLSEKTNAILAEIGRVMSAPAAPEDVANTITAQVDAIATPPRVVGGKLVFPQHVIDSSGMALTVTNVEGLFAWLHRDVMIAAMVADAETFDGPGLTAAERGKQLAAAQAKLLIALRAEAAAAMAAEQAGQRVIRRRHVHPAILLGLHVSPVASWDWLTKRRGM